jgi:8-amino-7-oxononanoate synthase
MSLISRRLDPANLPFAPGESSPLGRPVETEGCANRGIVNGHRVVLAGTNNYLGLTYDPRCIEAGVEALRRHGTGTTGSRMANGTYAEHLAMEAELAAFHDVPHALTFTTGYQANLGMISALGGADGVLMLDAECHASIFDGARLAGAQIYSFRHNDAADLEKRLRRLGERVADTLVVVEGIYSMRGDQAPLDAIAPVVRAAGACLLVDEAHALGVLGATGRGAAQAYRVEEQVDFVTGTFSKSLGATGGYCVSRHNLSFIVPLSRAYVFSASLTPAVVASVRTALRIVGAEPELRERLWRNVRAVHRACSELGLIQSPCSSPIIPVALAAPERALEIWHGLIAQGLYVNLIAPPASPGNYLLLRCSLSAAHTDEDVEAIIRAFRWLADRYGDSVLHLA